MQTQTQILRVNRASDLLSLTTKTLEFSGYRQIKYRRLCFFQTCCLRPPRRRWVFPGTSAFRFPDFRNESRISCSHGTNCSNSSSRSRLCSTGRSTRYSPPAGQSTTFTWVPAYNEFGYYEQGTGPT